jgi:hypothetical protein
MKKIFIFVATIFLCAQVFGQIPPADPANLSGNPSGGSRNAFFPDIFLKGNFIEVGVNDAGSYGTDDVPNPVLGYHNYIPVTWYGTFGIGFVADYEMDGWNTSSNPGVIPNYSGDYFLPGYPWEGFLVEYTYGGNDYTGKNCGALNDYGIVPSSITNTSSGTTQSALWNGTLTGGGQSLLVTQRTYFNINEARFFIEVTLKNTGSEVLNSVEYARHVDPDQEQNLYGDSYYTTSNYVSFPTGAAGFAEVVAMGVHRQVPMSLRLYHTNAKASVSLSGLEINTPDVILDSPYTPTQAAPFVADVGVGVAVRFASLSPGASQTFLVSYVLNNAEIEDPTPPPSEVPVSNWALYIGLMLIVTFTVIRFRKLN